MPTKLSRYCDGIMEAAWLAAVLVVPIFFNVYSSRIFEPDKIALLRTLALIILAAWLVKIIEVGREQWDTLKATGSPWRTFLKTPMVLPVLGLIMVYALATIFSITPEISLWGSYQRLQGTYTTFSHLIIFGAIVGNMRQRAQVDRLITVVILGSLPVSLYGVLQRFGKDTIPWGGDTVQRIAANMGNSIFVAAYLIMVFPITLSRVVEKFRKILTNTDQVIIPMILATIYVFIGSLQVIAIYMSGSRGPVLGLVASLFVFLLLLSLFWRKRLITLGMVAAAGVIGISLLAFNLGGSALESLRSSPVVGRFGTLLDSGSTSALVRRYIWEGVIDLVAPHQPLKFPDGTEDRFNILRPLIGYGPESMYVAFNQYYVPDLGKVERRNASPDRSHNETWDSMVITGSAGLVVYLIIFATVFYYGYKWLGLISTRRYKYLFLGLYIGSGVSGALFFSLWRGIEYLGIGLPFGIMLGLIGYVVLVALFSDFEAPKNESQTIRFFIILGIVSSLLAHFIEINFGISIAVTRSYLWVFTGVMVVVGYWMPRLGEYGFGEAVQASDQGFAGGAPGATSKQAVMASGVDSPVSDKRTSGTYGKKRKRDDRPGSARGGEARQIGGMGFSGWQIQSLAGAGLVGIILITLGFNYIYNISGHIDTLAILGEFANSKFSGILLLLFTTWVVASVVFSAEDSSGDENTTQSTKLLTRILNILGLSGIVALIYFLWHAGSLAALANSQVNTLDDLIMEVKRYENLVTYYYIYLILLVFALAALLPSINHPLSPLVKSRRQLKFASSWLSLIVFPLLMIGAFYFASISNLRVTQADVAFKIGDSFARPESWGLATQVYKHAIDLSPTEDYYYLFLGRANLEESRTIQDAQARDQYLLDAKDNLIKAQSINPLNTDHTANLARLYSTWASYTVDPTLKSERAKISSEYFQTAVVLSPNNARLWSEWALHELTNNLDEDRARELLATALERDPEYDWAYALLGDFSKRDALQSQDS